MKNIQPLGQEAIAPVGSKEGYKGEGGEIGFREKKIESFLPTTRSTHPGWEADPKKNELHEAHGIKLPRIPGQKPPDSSNKAEKHLNPWIGRNDENMKQTTSFFWTTCAIVYAGTTLLFLYYSMLD